MLFTFSNVTAVWISRNFEDLIINEHLPCYSPCYSTWSFYQGTRIDIPTTLVTIAGIVVVFSTPLMLDFASWNDRSKKKNNNNTEREEAHFFGQEMGTARGVPT